MNKRFSEAPAFTSFTHLLGLVSCTSATVSSSGIQEGSTAPDTLTTPLVRKLTTSSLESFLCSITVTSPPRQRLLKCAQKCAAGRGCQITGYLKKMAGVTHRQSHGSGPPLLSAESGSERKEEDNRKPCSCGKRHKPGRYNGADSRQVKCIHTPGKTHAQHGTHKGMCGRYR